MFRLEDTLLADTGDSSTTLAAQCSWGERTGLLLCDFVYRIFGYLSSYMPSMSSENTPIPLPSQLELPISEPWVMQDPPQLLS